MLNTKGDYWNVHGKIKKGFQETKKNVFGLEFEIVSRRDIFNTFSYWEKGTLRGLEEKVITECKYVTTMHQSIENKTQIYPNVLSL